ncbi:uncharacterized protein LOC119399817 isoform X2 [Rhipicephalus sanguineus]|uniref:uncharacterized protein LOC119399817 isoform X2 n=1 Tax=Rhipicephalus sanguineus TaxID=34632 RepID=UPI0018953863|nr:uncharacterized protein LOC119399817 isoform X2 [Rhipicephalus sanguineus]
MMGRTMNQSAGLIFLVISTVIYKRGGTVGLLGRQGQSRSNVNMTDLYDLLNTTGWIWIHKVSVNVTTYWSSIKCVSYRPFNLTNTSVVLYYYLFNDNSGLGKYVHANLSYHNKPTMTEDWNYGYRGEISSQYLLKKKLRYWNSTEMCAVFKVRRKDIIMSSSEEFDERNGQPWCEIHVRNSALAQSRNFTTCDRAAKRYCKNIEPNITLMTYSCLTIVDSNDKAENRNDESQESSESYDSEVR